jgi:hypothetical protein
MWIKNLSLFALFQTISLPLFLISPSLFRTYTNTADSQSSVFNLQSQSPKTFYPAFLPPSILENTPIPKPKQNKTEQNYNNNKTKQRHHNTTNNQQSTSKSKQSKKTKGIRRPPARARANKNKRSGA